MLYPTKQTTEPAKQLADEASRPAFGQIGEAKVAAGQHEPVERDIVYVLREQPVQIHQTVPSAVFRYRQHRCRILLQDQFHASHKARKDAAQNWW